MKILLATPFMAQHADAGLFWAKALCELGHSLILWEYRLNPEPPKADYDFALILKGESIDPGKLKSPKVVYWPDALERTPGIEDLLKHYDKVFTPVRPTPDWMEWLPTGWDPAIHRDLSLERSIPSIYIGTANSGYKINMITEINPSWVGGNEWEYYVQREKPVAPATYLHELVGILNRGKILIDVHQSPSVGLNRKFFEMIACGFTIVDRVPGVREILNLDGVTFESPEHAKWLIEYYLLHPEERQKIWELEKKRIQPYTYRAAAERVWNLSKKGAGWKRYTDI